MLSQAFGESYYQQGQLRPPIRSAHDVEIVGGRPWNEGQGMMRVTTLSNVHLCLQDFLEMTVR